MTTGERLQKGLVRPLAIKIYVEFVKTAEYKKIMTRDYSQKEQETIIILEVFDRIQHQLMLRELTKLLNDPDPKAISKKMIELYETVCSHETELYKLSRLTDSQERELACMDTFYAMTPNETISILEVIEEIVQEGEKIL